MGADLWCFKDYNFIPEFEDYKLETFEDRELIYGIRVHSTFNNLLEELGIEGYFELIPYLRDRNLDALDKREKQAIEEWLLNQPLKGIAFIEQWDLFNIIKERLPDKLEYLQVLHDAWTEGYYLFFEY